MNFFSLSGFVIAALCLVMAIIMFSKGKVRLHRLWGIFCLSVMLWGIGAFMIGRTANPEEAELWWRITHIGVIFIPVLFTHFIYEYLSIRRPVVLTALYILAFFFITVNLTGDAFIANMRWVFNQFYYDSPPGPLYIPFTGFFFGLVLYSHVELWLAYKKAHGTQKLQMKYFFFGMLFSFAGGGLSFLPVYGIDLYPYFNVLSSLYIFIVGYAILRYRMMDIRLVITRSIVYTASVALVTGSFAFVTYLASEYIASGSPIGQIAIFAIASFAIVLLLEPIKIRFARITNAIFFRAAVDYPSVTRSLTNVINEEIQLSSLVQRFSEQLQQSLRLQRVTILLPVGENAYLAPYEVSHDESKKHTSVYSDTAFIQYLETQQRIILQDEVHQFIAEAKTRREKERFTRLLGSMEEMHAEVAIPIVHDDNTSAIVLLSRKLSGDGFSTQDIQLLEVLAPQMASSIQKALLFQESQEFAQKLEREVKRAKAEWKEANEKLKKLDTAKSEFMSIASHQLRTPLAGISGYLSMIEEGDYGEVSDDQKPIIHEISDGAQRLNRVVNIFLNVSRIEAGRFVMHFDTWSFEETVEGVCKQLQPIAEKKGIELVFEKVDLPDVEMDVEKIRDVLLNLVDNGIKYTPQGRVEVRVDATKRTVHFSVHDSGVGIAEDQAGKLFDKFVRGENIARVQPDGSGLGLYISKQIIEGHGGRIWAESAGEGKGSTFHFEIPIAGDEDAKRKTEEFNASARK